MRSHAHETRQPIRRAFKLRRSQRSNRSRRTGLTAIDLFAGCGGATLGFKNEGFRVVAAVEVDPIAAKTYRQNHPEVLLFEKDIRKISPRTLLRKAKLKQGEVAVVLGCPPCQGFSRVRRGGPDKHNALVRVFAEFVAAIKPRFFLLENVPGLVEGKGKRVFKEALNLLSSSGYSMVCRVLNAADYGVPQRRKRVVVIGGLGVPPVLPVPTHRSPRRSASATNGRLPLKPWVTVRRAIGRLKRLSAGKSDPTDPLHAAPRHGRLALRRIRCVPKDGGSRSSLPKTLVLDCHRGHDGHRDVYGRMKWGDVAPTITGGCDRVSKGRFIHPGQDRGITMREAALLQTFPKSYRFAGARPAIAQQLGNAVPAQLARAIARSIKQESWRGTSRSRNAVQRDALANETFGNLVPHEAGRRYGGRIGAHFPTASTAGIRRAAAKRHTRRPDRVVPSKAA